ncbi:MAG: hypothetical protein K6L76_11750 [Agarilytica sp.]
MSIVYLLKNQHEQYLNKSGEWVEGEAASTLFRSLHKDEAINQRVELSVKQMEMRIDIAKAELNKQGVPQLSIESHPQHNETNPEASSSNEAPAASDTPFESGPNISESANDEAPELQTDTVDAADTINTDTTDETKPEISAAS